MGRPHSPAHPITQLSTQNTTTRALPRPPAQEICSLPPSGIPQTPPCAFSLQGTQATPRSSVPRGDGASPAATPAGTWAPQGAALLFGQPLCFRRAGKGAGSCKSRSHSGARNLKKSKYIPPSNAKHRLAAHTYPPSGCARIGNFRISLLGWGGEIIKQPQTQFLLPKNKQKAPSAFAGHL